MLKARFFQWTLGQLPGREDIFSMTQMLLHQGRTGIIKCISPLLFYGNPVVLDVQELLLTSVERHMGNMSI